MFEFYLGLAELEQLLVELNSEQSISLHPHSHTHTPHMWCTRHDVDSVFQVTVSDQCAMYGSMKLYTNNGIISINTIKPGTTCLTGFEFQLYLNL